MNYDKIGEFIASKRKEKNMTQSDLAKKLGVTDKAVSKWERGLGCPDVSILELLSKELDVSILELLKGREIENEVIKVTEADDYIKESFTVSKEMTKKKISKILFYLIIIISFGFIVLSGLNYWKSNKGEKFEFNYGEYGIFESYGKVKTNIEAKLEKIKKDKGILTETEQKELIDITESMIAYADDFFIFKINPEKKYSINEIMVYFLEDVASSKYPQNLWITYMNIFNNHDMNNDYILRTIKSNMYMSTIYENEFLNYYRNNSLAYFNYESSNALLSILSIEYAGENDLPSHVENLFKALVDRLEVIDLFIDDILKAGSNNE